MSNMFHIMFSIVAGVSHEIIFYVFQLLYSYFQNRLISKVHLTLINLAKLQRAETFLNFLPNLSNCRHKLSSNLPLISQIQTMYTKKC